MWMCGSDTGGDDPAEEMLDYSTKGRLQFEGFILNVSAILLLL